MKQIHGTSLIPGTVWVPGKISNLRQEWTRRNGTIRGSKRSRFVVTFMKNNCMSFVKLFNSSKLDILDDLQISMI